MDKPKVLIVFGTRPEVIKCAPIVHALRRHPDISTQVCVTAQHREMMDQMLADFHLRSDYDLDLMVRNQDLIGLSARALPALQRVLKEARPDFLLVQGDTTTTFVAALASFYERVRVGHVEAGLRSFDRYNPYPEEVNRLLTSRLSELHFAPTETARRNLLAEGLPERDIVLTGNTVVDALQWSCGRVHRFQAPDLQEALSDVAPGDRLALVTAHRRENLGRPLERICRAILRLVDRHPRLHLFYPVHMNPQVQDTVRRLVRHPHAHLLQALDYLDLVHLLHRSHFVMTDSGGLQEEAPSLGKPVIVLRDVTERPEAVQAGVARLAGTDPDRIVELATRLVEDPAFYRSMARKVGIFGDGYASERIAQSLRRRLGLTTRPILDFEPGETGRPVNGGARPPDEG